MSAPVKRSEEKIETESSSSALATYELKDRVNPEIVLGFVGPIGSGVTSVAEEFERILKEDFGYKTQFHKVSNVIRDCSNMVADPKDVAESGAERTRDLQELGNSLRNKFGSDYLTKKVIEKVALSRKADGGYVEPASDSQVSPPVGIRRAILIDSIKHPSEFNLLRQVYGDSFWLIAVFAPEDVRKNRLEKNGSNGDTLDQIIRHDEDEKEEFGQKVRDTSHLADFFIRNDGAANKFKTTSARFLDLIFGTEIVPPTRDEWAMAEAMTAAARSSCLSRSVGAAIVSEPGEMIGLGWNDVPKYGGSLYEDNDRDNDHRCFRHAMGICHNDDNKGKIYDEIVSTLKDSGCLDNTIDDNVVREMVSKSKIKNLIEFSRAVHAEMEAIVSVARGGKNGLVGSTLYSTAYPCHSCARHIVAAGIDKVTYIEPYPKSLALRLHDDAICADTSASNKVQFLQYEGVAPRNVERLFNSGAPRKQGGRAIVVSKKSALPAVMPPLDGFTHREMLIVNQVEGMENK
ncbi:anti-phage dCTP deaminase [Pyruvatibacter sp. HU-CL02332]|uniref:anti-phage dCTP deaminase n=1 Tax=Pyruvatibacter sp. HU-CL02332 TaxID=3127650 RepID=UPI003102FB04